MKMSGGRAQQQIIEFNKKRDAERKGQKDQPKESTPIVKPDHEKKFQFLKKIDQLEKILKTKSITPDALTLANEVVTLATQLNDSEKVLLASFYKHLTEKKYDEAREAYLELLKIDHQKYFDSFSYLRFEDIEILLHEQKILSSPDDLKKYKKAFQEELKLSPAKALAFIFAIYDDKLTSENEDISLLADLMIINGAQLFALHRNGQIEPLIIKLGKKYPIDYQRAMKEVATHYHNYNFQHTFVCNSPSSILYKRIEIGDPLIRDYKLNFNNGMYNNLSSLHGTPVDLASTINSSITNALRKKIAEVKKIYSGNNDFIKALEKLATDLEKSDDPITATLVAVCTGDMLDRIDLTKGQDFNQPFLDSYLEDTSKLVRASLFSKAIRAVVTAAVALITILAVGACLATANPVGAIASGVIGGAATVACASSFFWQPKLMRDVNAVVKEAKKEASREHLIRLN